MVFKMLDWCYFGAVELEGGHTHRESHEGGSDAVSDLSTPELSGSGACLLQSFQRSLGPWSQNVDSIFRSTIY